MPQKASVGSRWRAHRNALALAATIFVAVVVGLGVFRSHWMRQAPATGVVATKPSIAVLPLQNLSGDPANDYFSDGMTEEIGTKLSLIQSLKVVSYSATSRFKGAQKTPDEIGRDLQVRYVLAGSVRKAKNQVRVSVQLIDTPTGFQVWADDFTGELKDIFALQEQTALKISAALNLKLSPQEQQAIERRYTQNAEAYDAYLRGIALAWYWDNPEKLDAARREFERALNSDPKYPLALAGLSRVENFYYRNVDAKNAHLLRAEEYAQRALAIDPQLGDAHVSLALVYANRYEYARASEQAREATQAEPENVQAWVCLSWTLGYEQPPKAVEAEQAAREAIRLQPSLSGAYYELGIALLLQRRFPEAIIALEQSKKLDPGSTFVDFGLARVYLAQGDYDRAITLLLKQGSHPITLFQLSSAYAARGDKEKALEMLQKALDAGYRDFPSIDASPYFSSLRSEPRFQQLMQRYRK